MKTQTKTMDTLKRLALAVAATTLLAAQADATYDESTGYVTIPANNYDDSSGSNGKTDCLFLTAGVNKHWSDSAAPHPDTNYYVNTCLCVYNGAFAGGKMVLGPKGYLRHGGKHDTYSPAGATAATIADLVVMGKASFNAQLSGGKTFAGKMTLDDSATAAAPFSIVGARGGTEDVVNMDLAGSSATFMRVHAWKYFNKDGSTQHTLGPMKTRFGGDNSAFFGTLEVWTNMTVRTTSGFPNATVRVDSPTGEFAVMPGSAGPVALKDVQVVAGAFVVTNDAPAVRIGSLSVADGLRFDVGTGVPGVEIGDLALGDGAKLVFKGETADGSPLLVVTNSVRLAGSVDLALPSATTGRNLKIMAIPADKGDFDVSAFRHENPNFQYDLLKRTENGTNLLVAVNLAPSVRDGSAGYVAVDAAALAANESSKAYKKVFETAALWENGELPDNPAYDYLLCGNSRARFSKEFKFLGRSLTIAAGGSTGKMVSGDGFGEGYFEADDFIVMDGFAPYYNGGGEFVLRGKRLTFFATSKSNYAFAPFNNNINKSPARFRFRHDDLRGGKDVVVQLGAGAYNRVPMYFHFEGGQTNFYGTVSVIAKENCDKTEYGAQPNFALLGGTGLPNGTVELAHTNAVVGTCGADAQSVPLGRLTQTTASGRMEIAATNELAVGSAELAGTLDKTGAGVLALGPVTTAASAAATARVRVVEGGFRALCAEPFTGTSALTLEDGAVYVRDVRDAALAAQGFVMTNGLLDCEGMLKVRIDGVAEDGPACTVALMTLPAAQADALAGRISFVRIPNRRVKLLVGEETDGAKTLSAKIVATGTTVIVR